MDRVLNEQAGQREIEDERDKARGKDSKTDKARQIERQRVCVCVFLIRLDWLNK